MSETELLQAFRKERSEEAFAELVRRYAGLVYSVAKRRLANAALAEDITQIVFIRFAKAPPRAQTHAELVAWLHRTTLNVTIDMWRSETRRRTREQQAVVMESSTNIDWEEISPKVDEALNQLNDQDRQALLLRFFGQKSMRDIGAALGVSEDAAKMRVSRAVERLRTQLGVGGAAWNALVLGTMLAEHSVEAAPSQLISRLAAMKLPAVVGVSGMGGFVDALLRTPRFKLAAWLVALTVLCVSGVHLIRPRITPIPQASTSPDGIAKPAETARLNPTADKVPVGAPIKAVKIFFHVVDAETGGGLAQTKIHFAFFGAGGQGESHEILTDNNGDAAIPEPDDSAKNGGPNVFVTAEGHVPKVVSFHNGAVPAEYTMKLDPAMTAGGIVVDEQRLPVSGVEIKIQNPGNIPGQIENVDFQTCPVTNRDDGSWSCSYIPKDYTNEIRFVLKRPGYAVTFPVVPVAQVYLTNLVLVINRGFTIAGQVTDAQKQPVGDAEIKLLNGDFHKRQSVKTDEHGEFTLAGVTASGAFYQEPPIITNETGGIIVMGLAPMTSAQTPKTVLTAESLRHLENLRLESQADLDRQKALLERLKQVPKEELAKAISTAGVQDPLLNSLLEQLDPQEHIATVSALQQKMDARAQEVLPGLEASAASKEQSLKQLNESVGALLSMDANEASREKSLKQLNEFADKPISRGDQSPQHVDLAVQAQGFAAQTFQVDLVTVTNVANFTLAPGKSFQGKVVDATGNPIANAVVQTDFDFKNQIEKSFEWTAHTDLNGRFEWDSAPSQATCYWFEAEGYHAIRGLSLAADGSDHNIVLKTKN